MCICAEELEDSFVQFSSELVNARRCATTGSGFLTGHPCCGGPDSTCGGAADAVYRWSSISLLWHRGSMGKLRENCRRPQAPF